MKTLTYNVYSFRELSPKAQERACQDAASALGYTWQEDAMKSLRALADHFGCKLKDWSIDFFNCSYSSASFVTPYMDEAEIATKLAQLGDYNPETLRGNGSCVLTGFCMDEDAIDGFRKAWHGGERDLNKLLEAAFRSWLASAQADCADAYTPETYAETAEANGYEYEESGVMA